MASTPVPAGNETVHAAGDIARDMVVGNLASLQTPAGAPPAPPAAPAAPPATPPVAVPVATPPAGTPPAVAGTPPAALGSLSDRFTKPPEEIAAAKTAAGQPPAAPAAPEPPAPELEGAPDKARHAFARLRTERNQFERDLQAKAKLLSDVEIARDQLAQEKVTLLADRDKAIQDRDALQDRLGRISLAESPAFQQKYTQKETEIEARLASALVKFGRVTPEAAPAKARDLLRAPTDALTGLTKDMQPTVQGAVMMLASEFADINTQKTLELDNWRKTSAAMGMEAVRENTIRSAEQRRSWADAAIDAARKIGNPVFAATDAEGVKLAESAAAAFQGFVQTATEEQLTRAAAEGFVAPLLYDTIAQLTMALQQQQAQLDAFLRAQGVPMRPFVPQAPAAPPAPPAAALTAAKGDPIQDLKDATASMLRQFQGQPAQ